MDQGIRKKIVIGEENEIVPRKEEEVKVEVKKLKKPKKPLGSYFVFMKDYKERNIGMSRAEATKYWNEMPKSEKAKYVNLSGELKKEYLKKLKEWEEQQGDDDEEDRDVQESEKIVSLLPYARVKSILKSDEENSGNLRKTVIQLIQSASEKFASNLILASIQNLRKTGKSTLKRKHIIAGVLEEYKYSFLLDSCIFEESEIQEAEKNKRNFLKSDNKKSGKKKGRRSDNNQLLSDVINNGKMVEEKISIEKIENFVEQEIEEEIRIVEEEKPKKKSGNNLFKYFNKKG